MGLNPKRQARSKIIDGDTSLTVAVYYGRRLHDLDELLRLGSCDANYAAVRKQEIEAVCQRLKIPARLINKYKEEFDGTTKNGYR